MKRSARLSNRPARWIAGIVACSGLASGVLGAGFRVPPLTEADHAGYVEALELSEPQERAMRAVFDDYLRANRDLDRVYLSRHDWLMAFQPAQFQSHDEQLAVAVSARIARTEVLWQTTCRELQKAYFEDASRIPGIDSARVEELRRSRLRTWVLAQAREHDLRGLHHGADVDLIAVFQAVELSSESGDRIAGIMVDYSRRCEACLGALDARMFTRNDEAREGFQRLREARKQQDVDGIRGGITNLTRVLSFDFDLGNDLRRLNLSTLAAVAPLLREHERLEVEAAVKPRLYPELYTDVEARMLRTMSSLLASGLLDKATRNALIAIDAERISLEQRLTPALDEQHEQQTTIHRETQNAQLLMANGLTPEPAPAPRNAALDEQLKPWRSGLERWRREVAAMADAGGRP